MLSGLFKNLGSTPSDFFSNPINSYQLNFKSFLIKHNIKKSFLNKRKRKGSLESHIP